LEITKGKLISHKEWASDGAVASYLPGTKSFKDVVDSGSSANMLGRTGTQITAETHSVATTVGQPVTIANDGFVWIINTSDEVKQYRYNFHICASNLESQTECVYTEDVVELQPRGSFASARKPTLELTFDKPGVYNMYAQSFFTTAPMQTSIVSSASTGTITVS
jgi:hypothetical protein